MTLIFDRNLSSERTLPCDRVYFRANEGIVQGIYDTVISQISDLPDLSDFISNPNFTTLHINTGEVEIPVDNVNIITDILGNLYGQGNFNLTVTLGQADTNDN